MTICAKHMFYYRKALAPGTPFLTPWWSLSRSPYPLPTHQLFIMDTPLIQFLHPPLKGVLSSPNPKGHRLLPVDTEEAIKDFYLSDNISRVMPGKKDFLSVVGADGKREHKQKRLVLCNLREAYREFKECNPDKKIGSSFHNCAQRSVF